MLYRFIVGNFKSFAEETQFDLFPFMGNEALSNHIYTDGAVPALRYSALYGPNGAGKSNLIEAMLSMKRFATEFVAGGTQIKDEGINWYETNRFRLPVTDDSKPISFLVEFENLGKAYLYSLKIDRKGIREEKLQLSGCGKEANKIIYTREYDKLELEEKGVNGSVNYIFKRHFKRNPFASLLAVNGALLLINRKEITGAYGWFKSKLDVIAMNRDIPWLLDMFRKKPQLVEFVGDIFGKIGLGITELSIDEKGFDEWMGSGKISKEVLMRIRDNAKGIHIAKMRDSVPAYTITEEDGKRLVRQLLFKQLGKGRGKYDMDAESQSTGTLRLLTLLPAIYSAINGDKTVVIDEIENSIHPVLIQRLIRYFGEAAAKGQLIFSTHETSLLSKRTLLRPDEVWLMEKKEGGTIMYTLNNFKIREGVSMEADYLEGLYGAVPPDGAL